ncbi:MAG: 5'-methylthioinosine phosphorylase [Candidatus Endobugula sp.]|jgi:5'-methylthioinosine phosphorylase
MKIKDHLCKGIHFTLKIRIYMAIAIIGGSGLTQLTTLGESKPITQATPFGHHSQGVCRLTNNQREIIFLPRHGDQHQYPPHKVNYRANLWLLKSLGITKIIACNVVGGISENMPPRTLVVPHQIIDYTWGREHTFYDGENNAIEGVEHIDFTHPYSEALRQRMLAFFEQTGIDHINHGVYACTQGPRLETAAEIQRFKNDGCDVVGMTAMPEAALSRELAIDYTALNLVVNWAPGLAADELSMTIIMALVKTEMEKICQFLPNLIKFLEMDH